MFHQCRCGLAPTITALESVAGHGGQNGLRDIMASVSKELKHRYFEFRIAEAKHNWQHPRNTAEIYLDGTYVGFITVVHPSVQSKIDKKAVIVAGELNMDTLSSMAASVIHYEEPSKFPGIDMDLSLVVPEGVTFRALSGAWADVDADLLTGVSLIDSFEQILGTDIGGHD